MRRVGRVPALFLLSGAVAATGFALGGDPVMAAVILVLFTLFAVVHSPLIFPGPVPAAEALRRAAADGRPVVYWRPGCTYCLRLRLRLGRDASRLHWVNIWRDPAGAAAVRAATGGTRPCRPSSSRTGRTSTRTRRGYADSCRPARDRPGRGTVLQLSTRTDGMNPYGWAG
ncbi:hypothetical protein SBADM41S_07164 [Streptomyces badius]